MRYVIKKNGKKFDGWGTFKCSVCSKDVFIQYDSHEKPSNGMIVTHKGRCYCLCSECVEKCIDKGKAKVLKDAKDYKPTDNTKHKEPEYLKDVPSEYRSIASLIPAFVVIAIISIELKRIKSLPKEQQKKAMEKLKRKLKDREYD